MTLTGRGLAGFGIAVLAGSCTPSAAHPPASLSIPSSSTVTTREMPAAVRPAGVAMPIAGEATTTTASGIILAGQLRQGGLVRGRVPAGTVALALDGGAVSLASDGAFVIGFDRDSRLAATLTTTAADGTTRTDRLEVAAVAWDVQSLPTLPKQTPRTPQEIAIRAGEVARIAAARAHGHDVDGWRQTFLWPATGRISGVFGSQRVYAGEPGAYHGGVDIARPTGTPVMTPADGVVVLAAVPEPFTLEGHLLMIDHGMGLTSAFLHLSRIDVVEGQHVVRGQIIGAIGMTGRATGPHLHWAMTWAGRRIDAAGVAGAMER